MYEGLGQTKEGIVYIYMHVYIQINMYNCTQEERPTILCGSHAELHAVTTENPLLFRVEFCEFTYMYMYSVHVLRIPPQTSLIIIINSTMCQN